MSIFDIFRQRTKLRELEDRIGTLEAEAKQLQLEWSSVYDNVRRLFQKISKRDQRERDLREDAPGATNGAPVGGSEAEMNERIRASRRRPV